MDQHRTVVRLVAKGDHTAIDVGAVDGHQAAILFECRIKAKDDVGPGISASVDKTHGEVTGELIGVGQQLNIDRIAGQIGEIV